MTPWTQRHLSWVRQLTCEHPALEATRRDYLHEVDHVADRITRLDAAIADAARAAPPHMRAVIEALQALRGIALTSAVTIVTEVGQLSRFGRACQLMGYGEWACARTRAAPARGGAALQPRATGT